MAILSMKRDELPTHLGGGSDLLLGNGAEFQGRLVVKGTVRIDARVQGSIESDGTLVVGERARIDADITGGTVVVHGEVTGDIRARDAVELLRGARVRGDIQAPALVVERGSIVQGHVRMLDFEQVEPPPSP